MRQVGRTESLNFVGASWIDEPVHGSPTNTNSLPREHFAVLGTDARPFAVDNPWFNSTAALTVYHLDQSTLRPNTSITNLYRFVMPTE